MDAAFEVHMLNEQGKQKAVAIAGDFNQLLYSVAALSGISVENPKSREFAIFRTKLEEACFFAKKAMASQPENQQS